MVATRWTDYADPSGAVVALLHDTRDIWSAPALFWEPAYVLSLAHDRWKRDIKDLIDVWRQDDPRLYSGQWTPSVGHDVLAVTVVGGDDFRRMCLKLIDKLPIMVPRRHVDYGSLIGEQARGRRQVDSIENWLEAVRQWRGQ